MLRSLSVMLDYHLSAVDGFQGIVHDFLFDDETWVVHYLVAETATAVGKHNVLLLPFVLGHPDWERKQVPVDLSCQQIRNSPPIEADLPISLQYQTGLKQPGSHLRSLREVLGYAVHGAGGQTGSSQTGSSQTGSGQIGSIQDLIVEDMLWGVHRVAVKLAGSGHAVSLPPETFRSISWRGKAAWVNLTLDDLAQYPEFDPAQPVNQDRAHRRFDYYGRLVTSPTGLGESQPPPESHPHRLRP